jgi:hypothetical protein
MFAKKVILFLPATQPCKGILFKEERSVSIMELGGFADRIAWVDLTAGNVEFMPVPEEDARRAWQDMKTELDNE